MDPGLLAAKSTKLSLSVSLTDLSFIMIALIFVKFQDNCQMYKNISLAVEKMAAFIEDEKVRYCQLYHFRKRKKSSREVKQVRFFQQ